MGGNLIFMKA